MVTGCHGPWSTGTSAGLKHHATGDGEYDPQIDTTRSLLPEGIVGLGKENDGTQAIAGSDVPVFREVVPPALPVGPGADGTLRGAAGPRDLLGQLRA
jgi:hypothetical protein